jgi:CheY-like chemotaxis protein
LNKGARPWCAVETAGDGGAAMERLRDTVPDAVLVSLSVPEMAGGAFVQACQQDPVCGGVPIVVMAVTPRAAVEAIRMGARGHIRKPVEGIMRAAPASSTSTVRVSVPLSKSCSADITPPLLVP